MTIELDLPPETEERLRKRAELVGQDPATYVQALVDRDLSGEQPSPQSLAELLAGRVGVVHSGGGERLSEDTGGKFTDYLEQKRREGHL
jgi:hypothetical protein